MSVMSNERTDHAMAGQLAYEKTCYICCAIHTYIRGVGLGLVGLTMMDGRPNGVMMV